MHQPKLNLPLTGVGAVGGQRARGVSFLPKRPVVLPAVQRAIRAADFAGAAQVIGKQIIQLVRAAVNHAHGHSLSTSQVVELPRHACQVGIAGRRGGGRARLGCRGGGGARLGDGARSAGCVGVGIGARGGRRGGLSEVRCEGLYDHCFGVGLGLGDARRSFGRRARARRRVGLGGGGRPCGRTGFGRRQRAGAAGYRRARHRRAERGARSQSTLRVAVGVAAAAPL